MGNEVARSGHEAGPEQAATRAWQSARDYARHLASGGKPSRIFVNGILLHAGEQATFETGATYERFWGGDGTYVRSGGLFLGSPAFVAAGLVGTAIGNSVRKNRARADAVPNWRERQELAVIGTTHRLLCAVAGRGWLSFWWNGMQEFYPEPRSWSLVLVWPGVEPLRLSGLAAPYLGVHVRAHVMPGQWVHHPAVAELAG
jgi:hypothetical protein